MATRKISYQTPTKDTEIIFKLPDNEKKLFARRCKAAGLTTSEMLRQLVALVNASPRKTIEQFKSISTVLQMSSVFFNTVLEVVSIGKTTGKKKKKAVRHEN